MLPILMGTAVPFVIIVAIVFVLRPKGEAPKVPNQRFQSHVYVSTTWAPPRKIEPYKYQMREDPAEANPIFDELEVLMRESEARMNAAIAAAAILGQLGAKAKKELSRV